VEHVVAKQHGGSDDIDNLALACHRCNLQKGPNLTGIDPVTAAVAPLFHPRRDRWADHFRMRAVRIEGVSARGRATVQVLAQPSQFGPDAAGNAFVFNKGKPKVCTTF
jgi:hypothetical protein